MLLGLPNFLGGVQGACGLVGTSFIFFFACLVLIPQCTWRCWRRRLPVRSRGVCHPMGASSAFSSFSLRSCRRSLGLFTQILPPDFRGKIWGRSSGSKGFKRHYVVRGRATTFSFPTFLFFLLFLGLFLPPFSPFPSSFLTGPRHIAAIFVGFADWWALLFIALSLLFFSDGFSTSCCLMLLIFGNYVCCRRECWAPIS